MDAVLSTELNVEEEHENRMLFLNGRLDSSRPVAVAVSPCALTVIEPIRLKVANLICSL